MKKLLLLVISFVLLMAMMIPVFAEEIVTENQTGQTVVTYGVDGKFKVVIPANFDLTGESEVVKEVSASDVYLNYNESLEVLISSTKYDQVEGKWQLVDTISDSNKIDYKIGTASGLSDIKNNDTVLRIAAGDTDGDKSSLYFSLDEVPTVAGSYEDILSFTVKVVTPEA